MSQHRPVPRLDLAPKLKRPLSLWNPLDYLRLLYWVFYFPQALRWYVDTFGGGYIPPKEMNWRKGLQLLRQNLIHRQLFVQGLVLTVVIPVAYCGLLQQMGFEIDWRSVAQVVGLGVALGLVFGGSGAVGVGVALGVGLGVAGGVALGVEFGVGLGVRFAVQVGVGASVVGGLSVGVALGVAFGVALGVAGGMAFGVALGMAVGVAGGLMGGVALGVEFGVVVGVAFGVAVGVAGGVAILRPENWLIGLPLNLQHIQNGSWLFPRITSIPLPYLQLRLQNWLQQDWETGLHNINQLLAYTLQFIPIVQSVNQILEKTPSDKLIWRVSRLAEAPFDWNLVGFASASLQKEFQSKFIR
ncbi:MAG: hypothetical protein ACNS61_11715, partial [Candidatus Wenzhouxiangella sp. M2_3B_020]